MSWNRWLASLANLSGRTPRRAAPRRRVSRLRLGVEFLESRELLSATTWTVANTLDAGPGSLRQALVDANATANDLSKPDIIQFNIPGAAPHTIALLSGLPAITDSVTIDGWSQPGFAGSPIIELDGSGAGPANGLVVTAPDTTIRGLVINRFSDGSGIFVGAASTNVWIYGSYLGTDATGTLDGGNGFGIFINGANHVTIGTNGDNLSDVAERNVVSGNDLYDGGIAVWNARDVVIQGNYIGTDVTGTASIPNHTSGIRIENSAQLRIGGTSPDAGNLISGNGYIGMSIFSVNNFTIQGNRIGTNAAGTIALPNVNAGGGGFGIILQGNDGLIGGTAPGAGNLVSGHGYGGIAVTGNNVTIQGNKVGTDVTGSYAIGTPGHGVGISGSNNLVGGTAAGAGNLISGNAGAGVAVNSGPGSLTNRIEGNRIGTDITGSYSIGNGDGVLIGFGGGSNTTVGGTDPAAGNLISGNTGAGVTIAGSNATGNLVQGNFVGTDFSGMTAVPNLYSGIVIYGAHDNAIVGNLISGNGNVGGGGVYLVLATHNTIQGNTIGTNVSGTAALPNSGNGVLLYYGNTDNLIGGIDPTARNLISGNGQNGIMMQEPTVQNNTVQGNYIGTDITGTSAIGNGLTGVLIYQAANNVIGGAAPGEGNIISGNGGDGVGIHIPSATGNVVQGNFIGTDASGTLNLGNGRWGVSLGAPGNTIGGVSLGEENTIAFNQNAGVAVLGYTENAIRGNAIYDNGGLGIDLGSTGVTPNDAGDGDSGPNNLQNFPVIASSEAGLTTHVVGSLNSTPNTTFTLDFYASASADPSGFGEGQHYLGTITVTTGGSGDASFDAYLAAATTDGEFITATATDPDGNTSEFSGQVVAVNQPPTADAGGPYFVFEGGSVVLDGTNSSDPNQPAGTLIYQWDLDGDTIFGEVGAAASRGDETGMTPTFSAAGLDGPSSITVTLRVTDNGGLSAEDTATVTIDNVAPTATNNAYSTSQATPVAGNVITDNTGSGADSDPAGANDPLTVSSYTQPASGTLALNADGSFVYTPNSTFSGTDSFTYTISDGDGGFSTATVTITVVAAAPGSILTIPDTCEGGTALLITGTAAGDTIVVEPGPTAATLTVTINGTTSTVAKPSGRIIVTGGAGDDNIQIAGSVSNMTWLYGDADNDRIYGGGGASLIIGGDGNDQLLGGSGRDILVGGQGADKLVGNANDDILIAEYTTKDDRATVGHEHFWCDVLKEWNSINSFIDRVNNLRGAATQQANANNGASYLLPEAKDDNTADDIDMLQGSSGDDWFIFKVGEDKVVGQQEGSN